MFLKPIFEKQGSAKSPCTVSLKNFVQDSSFSDSPQILSPIEPQKKESSCVPAETSSAEKTTKKKFDEFMTILASHEDLETLDPNVLISHLRIEGVISHEDCERTQTEKSISARKTVRIVQQYVGWVENVKKNVLIHFLKYCN